jgi:hypothetical protein
MRTSRLFILAFVAALLTQCGTEPEPPKVQPTAKPATLRLDSIAIDEARQTLMLFGEFDSAVALNVMCDSVLLTITSSDSSRILASIPDSGKGSCGWVFVKSGSVETEKRLITYWSFYNTHHFWHTYSDGGSEEMIDEDTVYLRGDYLGSRFSKRDLRVRPALISRYFEFADGNDGIHGYKYTGPKYNRRGPVVDTFIVNPAGIYDPHADHFLMLDTTGSIIRKTYDFSHCGGGGGGDCTHWGEVARTRFPVPR